MTEELRRNSWQVLKDLLLVAKGGAIITRLVYGANSNFEHVRGYLAYAEEVGLLRVIGDQWFTTEKGVEFVLRVLDLEAMLTSKE